MSGILQGWRVEGGTLVRSRSQPDRVQLLEHNQELRNNPGALRDMSFAGLEMNLPELDYYLLIEQYPDLNSPDAEIKTKAWRKFMASPLADPYRVRDRPRARALAPVTRRKTTEVN